MTNVARALGLERSHLYKKCQQLGIDLQSLRKPDRFGLHRKLVCRVGPSEQETTKLFNLSNIHSGPGYADFA